MAGPPSATSAEPVLFHYGIRTEKSDIRAHVGVLARSVFIFRTKHGIEAIEKHNPPLRPAYQGGVVGKTAEGYPVQMGWVRDLRVRNLSHWPVWDGWTQALSTTEKGRRAVKLVCELLKHGLFPLWVNADDDDRKSIQLHGTDVVVFARQRIQVKCDYRAGWVNDGTIRKHPGHPMCTGNLFLQDYERNPLQRH